MTRHRPRRRPDWLWPVSWLVTAAIVVLLWSLPQSWWDAIWPRGELRGRHLAGEPAVVLEIVELEIRRPPPEVEVVEQPAPTRSREPFVDTDWWQRSWQFRIASDLGRSAAVLPDSLLPAPLLAIYGAQATVDLILAAPDSLVQARLWQLVSEEALARDDLDGLFSAIAKARAYADLKSREAAMFDEFQFETVPVPR